MPGFTMVSNALESADLDPYQFRMMVHIMRVGESWEGIRTLADKCKMSTGKASTTKKWLLDNGWIVWTVSDTGKMAVTAANPLPCDRSSDEQPQQPNRSPHEHRSPDEHQRSPHEQNRSPHEHKHTKEALLNETDYIPPQEYPSPEKETARAEMVTAISQQVKDTYWAKTEDDFHDAADAIIAMGDCPDDVEGFAPWWTVNGHYNGKPALKSFMQNYKSYRAGETFSKNGQHPAGKTGQPSRDELPEVMGEF